MASPLLLGRFVNKILTNIQIEKNVHVTKAKLKLVSLLVRLVKIVCGGGGTTRAAGSFCSVSDYSAV